MASTSADVLPVLSMTSAFVGVTGPTRADVLPVLSTTSAFVGVIGPTRADVLADWGIAVARG